MLKVLIADREWEFPATPGYKAANWLNTHQRDNAPHILEAGSPIPALSQLLTGQPVSSQTMQELHYIGSCLDSFTEEEEIRFRAAVNQPDVRTIPDIVTASCNLDRYIALDTTDAEELGHRLVKTGIRSFPNDVIPYLDYRRLGEECMADGIAYAAEGILLIHDGKPDTWRYNGRDLPDMPGGVVFRVTLISPKGNEFWLALPADDDMQQKAWESLGAEYLDDCHLTNVKAHGELEQVLPAIGYFSDLNRVAQEIKEMSRQEYHTYLAAMEVERPHDYSDAVDIALDIDRYKLMPSDVDYPEAYARHVLDDPDNEFYIEEEIADFIDYERYGKYKMEEDGVRETEQGWIIRKDSPFPPEARQEMNLEPTMGGM